ncbi:MAG: hypothetical protein LBS20_06700 [Prevotella sp.]|jgi:hypothetical protein|nr:hypothetical protein [Prevotella sp.]
MKKFAFLFLTLPFFLLSCGDDDEPTTEYKDVTVELEYSSESLSILKEGAMFTLDSEPVYNKSDWSTAFENTESEEYQFVLIKQNLDLTNKSIFSFKQKKVNFLLQCSYSFKDESREDYEFNVDTKVTIKINGKVVKTGTLEALSSWQKYINYSE